MGLPTHLIPALVCLLACSSNFIYGCKVNNTLVETIKMLNNLTARKDPRCMELPIADVLAISKNTTERETFCRVVTALRQLYQHHECPFRRYLNMLDRNLSSMGTKTCRVSQVGRTTLRDFLERLRRIMQEKYARG